MAELLSAAGSFATEGERRAAEVLKQLPDAWLVICNKTLSTSNGRSFEMDFVVVGKRWVFLLDEKSWRGRIRGNDEQWVRSDGSSERSPLAKVDYVTKVLAGHLNWRIPALKEGAHYVRGGILLSATDQQPQILDPRAANGVFLIENVCQRLQALDVQGGNPYVGQVHNLIRKALVDLSNRPAMPDRIDLYTIDDAIIVRPGVRLFHATMDGGEPRLLIVYDLGRDPLAAQEQYNFYLREFRVLKELYATGLVAEVQDPSKWSEDFLVLPIVPLKGEPLSLCPRPETREELAQELLVASASFKGLDIIHSKNIVHRAIGPDAVYILQKGQSPKIAFTNFFAARFGASTIAEPLDKLSLVFEDPFASFNLAVGYELATPATDVFSLALTFLERISGVSISAIRTTVESEINFPDLQKRWSILPVKVAAELSELFRQIVFSENNTPPTAKEIASRLGELARSLRTEMPNDEETHLFNGRFKIQRVLGQGTMAKTYLATYAAYSEEDFGRFVLKRFLRPEDIYDQAKAEYNALKQIKSKYLPRIEEIYLPEDDAHIKMEHIPGPTLKERESTFPLESSAQAMRSRFFDGDRIDNALQRAYLANVIRFYFERSRRYKLFDLAAEQTFIEQLAKLEKSGMDFRPNYEGYIVSLEGEQRKPLFVETQTEKAKIHVLTAQDLDDATEFSPLQMYSVQSKELVPIEVEEDQLSNTSTEEEDSESSPVGELSAMELGESISYQDEELVTHPASDTPKVEQAFSPVGEIVIPLGEASGEPIEWTPAIAGSPHLFILGIPGQGKSWTITRILKELGEQHVPSLVLDFHGQFADSESPVVGMIRPLIVDAAQGLPFSPFECTRAPGAGGWKAASYALAEIFAYVTKMGQMQRDIIYIALQDAYKARGFADEDTVELEYPTSEEVLRRIRQEEQARHVNNVSARCRSLLEMDLFRPVEQASDLLSSIRAGMVIDLHNLYSEELQLAAGAFVLRKLYRDMFSWGYADRLRLVIVLDEAHRLARDVTLPKIMKEGRKFGIAVVVASQGMNDFHQDILGNAGTKVIFRMNYPDSKKVSGFIRGRQGHDLSDRISQLPVGSAYVQTPDMPYGEIVQMYPLDY